MAKWGTKNPPKKNGQYLVTIDAGFAGLQVRQANRYCVNNTWFWSVLPSGNGSEVIAWQKCPEPYKGDKQ